MDADDWELLDAGEGRRLERWGPHVVDRPAPSAVEARRDPGAWSRADLRFHRYAGWEPADIEPWAVRLGDLVVELRATETGQLGAFPEQAPNRAWVHDAVARLVGAAPSAPAPAVLNLFAYTGAATLAAARAGAAVAHVDASRPSVAWARRNAELSSLAGRPIRWLVDDAEAFVARESRRGRRYDGVILDPPSYGHGAGGKRWRLEERLPTLLAGVAAIAPAPAFVLLSAHTPGFDGATLAEQLAAAFGLPFRDVERGEMTLTAASGATLPLGHFARWRDRSSAARLPR